MITAGRRLAAGRAGPAARRTAPRLPSLLTGPRRATARHADRSAAACAAAPRIKYYNNSLFHNVQSNFIAQTGAPAGDTSGGSSIYG